jgi:hypothetical protein
MGHKPPNAMMRGKLKFCHTKLNGNFGSLGDEQFKAKAFCSNGDAAALVRFIDDTPIIRAGPLTRELNL